MGCGGSKAAVSVEAALQDVKANPIKGLPILKKALSQPGPGQEESNKQHIGSIFMELPKVITNITGKWIEKPGRQALLAMGDVIERCVKLANDPAVGAATPTLDADNIKQSLSLLTVLGQKAYKKGSATQSQHFMDDEVASEALTVIAKATKCFFKLEDHATALGQELAKSGVELFVNSLKVESGMSDPAKRAVIDMFAVVLEVPVAMQSFLDSQGVFVVMPFVEDPSSFGIGKEFRVACRGTLELCVKNGQNMTNLDQIKAAIAKAK